MAGAPPPRPPELGVGGTALWDSIAGVYELRPDEWRILRDACFEADIIDRLQREFAAGETTTRGSMGQEVAAPTLSELRQHRATLTSMLGKLKIPDSPAGSAQKRAAVSDAARSAARARWGSGRGA